MTEVEKLHRKLDAFIVQYSMERERDHRDQKEWVNYIKQDVSRALNGQKEVWTELSTQAGKIRELEIFEAKCPVKELSAELFRLKEETGEVRATYKYPMLRKSAQVFTIVSNIASILLAIGLILGLITNVIKIG